MASVKALIFSIFPNDCPGTTQTTCIDWLCIAALIIIPVSVVAGAFAVLPTIIRHTDNYWPGAVTLLVFGSIFFLQTSNRVSEQRCSLAQKLVIMAACLYYVCHHDAATTNRDETLRQVYAGLLVCLAIIFSIPLGSGCGLLFPKRTENSVLKNAGTSKRGSNTSKVLAGEKIDM